MKYYSFYLVILSGPGLNDHLYVSLLTILEMDSNIHNLFNANLKTVKKHILLYLIKYIKSSILRQQCINIVTKIIA